MTAHLETQLILLYALRPAVTHESLNRQGLSIRQDISVWRLRLMASKLLRKMKTMILAFLSNLYLLPRMNIIMKLS